MRKEFLLSRILERELPSGYRTAPLPDHPLLLQAPSLLVGGDGRLTAIFVVGRSGSLTPLAPRLTAARLALPSTTRMVAYTPPRVRPIPSSLQNDFDTLLEGDSSGASLVRYVRGDSRTRVRTDELLEMQQVHRARASALLQISRLRRERMRRVGPPDDLVRSFQEKNFAGPFGGVSYNRKPLEITDRRPSVRALRGGRNSRASLRAAWSFGLREGYVLDNGVPYMRKNRSASVLLVGEWPETRHDPEKPLRAAAFSGWVMTSAESIEDIELLISRMIEFVAKRP